MDNMAAAHRAGCSHGSDRLGNVSLARMDESDVPRWRLSVVRSHALDAGGKRDEGDFGN